MGSFFKRAIDSLLEFLYPHDCIGCGADGGLLCPACSELVIAAEHSRCVSCNSSCVLGSLCAACREGGGIDELYVLTTYEQPWVKELIASYKYEGVTEAGEILAGFLERACERRWRFSERVQPDAVAVPVPLARERERERGFNQSSLFSRAAAKAARATVVEGLLIRSRDTEHQASLDRVSRQKNIRDAFTVTEPALVRGKTILLVDDVYTTGATMRSCAQALKEAGACVVWGVALAHHIA